MIGWVSQSGFKQTGKWSFKAERDGGCEATLGMEYEFPGGIAGKVLAKAAEPIVKMNIAASVDELKRQAERMAAKSATKAR